MATNPADEDDPAASLGSRLAGAGGAMASSAAIAFPATLPASEAATTRAPPETLGHMLATGSRLRDYEITGLIGEGGFGIVYLAWDHSLQRKVAIKEYMPASMASRVAGSPSVVVKSERHLDTFKAGLKSFVNEARLLARFDHPSLVKVYRFWEDNGTAYMVMPFYEGPTLKAALASLGHVPSEDELRAWLKPLLDALAVMHAAQCFHRDIAPDNILLTATGPLLLDFGAARRVIGDMTHALTVVLKPGYAPIEQYGDVASMTQGAWTDLYALGCVVYYAITGHTPMSSVERLMDDRLEPLSTLAAGRYSPSFLGAIDAALAVRPQDRPRDEARFRALLDTDRPMPPTSQTPASVIEQGAFARTERYAHPTVPATLTPLLPTQVLARPTQAHPPMPASGPVRAEAIAPTAGPTRAWQTPVQAVASVRPETTPRRRPPIIAVLVLGVGAALFWMLRQPSLHVAPTATQTFARPTTTSPKLPVTPAPNLAAAPTTATATATTMAPPEIPHATAVAPSHNRIDEKGAAANANTSPPRSRPSPARTAPQTRAEEPRHSPGGARCSDILQKASLEPLTSEEAAYLKRECQ